jgi:hypothetical protein
MKDGRVYQYGHFVPSPNIGLLGSFPASRSSSSQSGCIRALQCLHFRRPPSSFQHIRHRSLVSGDASAAETEVACVRHGVRDMNPVSGSTKVVVSSTVNSGLENGANNLDPVSAGAMKSSRITINWGLGRGLWNAASDAVTEVARVERRGRETGSGSAGAMKSSAASDAAAEVSLPTGFGGGVRIPLLALIISSTIRSRCDW